MRKLLFIFGIFLLLISCGSDDDICLSSESTPRLKMRFRNADGALVRLDSLYVDVNYDGKTYKNIITQANVDSIRIPLRIDDSPYTDVRFRLRKREDTSNVRISYDKKAIYVSPACGFKINFENMKAELIKSSPVMEVQPNSTSLNNESQINFYLRF